MNFKKNLLVLFVALFSISFASCSDDEDVTPTVETETWTLGATTVSVKAANEETEKAIEDELSKSTYSVKSLELNSDGSYNSTLAGVAESGVFKMTSDSLFLTPKSTYETAVVTNKAYAVTAIDAAEMDLIEDLTANFADKYEGVEEVIFTLNLAK